MSQRYDREAQLRDEAWVGDAVLALYARKWILANPLPSDLPKTEAFRRMTSNHFLSAFGKPTAVEAKIGRLYEEEGVEAAFAYLDKNIIPLYLKQLHKDYRF